MKCKARNYSLHHIIANLISFFHIKIGLNFINNVNLLTIVKNLMFFLEKTVLFGQKEIKERLLFIFG